MKIAVNTRFLLHNKLEGIGWFTFHTLKRITEAHPEVEFHFLFDRPYHPSFIFGKNVQGHVIYPQARRPILWKIWYDYTVKAKLKQLKPDLFLSPDGFISQAAPCPQLAVIHDLNFEYHPEFVPGWALKYYKKNFRLAAQKATRVATVSEYSKQDIAQLYQIEAEKIDVLYNGVNDFFYPLELAHQERVRKKISGGSKYFVFVGALNPRKNVVGMLKSFELFKKQKSSDIKLVIVGEKMYWNEEMEACFQAMEYKDEVIFVGRKQGEELNEILASSIALWFVSHFEGFGIPLIEAFKAGTAAIASTKTSLPEIGANAALYAEPNDYNAIAQHMLSLASDEVLRQNLISLGMKRAHDFTWEKSAERLWESMLKTMKP